MSNRITALVQQFAAPGIDYTKAPPGSSKFLDLLGNLGFVALVICVGGFLVSGIMMIIKAVSGTHNEGGMKGLAWTCVGSIIIGGASLWATTLAG